MYKIFMGEEMMGHLNHTSLPVFWGGQCGGGGGGGAGQWGEGGGGQGCQDSQRDYVHLTNCTFPKPSAYFRIQPTELLFI
jgi:hypothetical protein